MGLTGSQEMIYYKHHAKHGCGSRGCDSQTEGTVGNIYIYWMISGGHLSIESAKDPLKILFA